MNIKIEKNIPIQGRKYDMYPFKEMKVKDSFFIPVDGEIKNKRSVQHKFSGLCSYFGRKLGRKYISRSVDGGIRVWRTR